MASVEGGVFVSSWSQIGTAGGRRKHALAGGRTVQGPRCACLHNHRGILAAHGFFLINTADGTMVNEGRSAPGGFSDLSARPGGGWALAGRRGEIHLFSQHGRGIRRVESGPVRRLVGWLDREHLLWQDPAGHLWCGRLTGDDRKRKLEERPWSWCSSLQGGTIVAPKQRRRSLGRCTSSVWLGHAESARIRQP